MAEQDSQSLPRFTAPAAKILVVDDLPTNLRMVKTLINPCGVRMFVSLSGKQAIEMVQKEQFDLVLMDQMMPEMDGMEAIARIRALEGDYYHQLPIVLFTANEINETEEALLQQGINGYIAKPIDVEKLFNTIQRLIPPEKVVMA